MRKTPKILKNCEDFKRDTNKKRYKNPSIGNSKLIDVDIIRVREHGRRAYVKFWGSHPCRLCGYSKHIEVCHLKAISEYHSDTKVSTINDICNLIGLCRNCHWELDNKYLNKAMLKRLIKQQIQKKKNNKIDKN